MTKRPETISKNRQAPDSAQGPTLSTGVESTCPAVDAEPAQCCFPSSFSQSTTLSHTDNDSPRSTNGLLGGEETSTCRNIYRSQNGSLLSLFGPQCVQLTLRAAPLG